MDRIHFLPMLSVMQSLELSKKGLMTIGAFDVEVFSFRVILFGSTVLRSYDKLFTGDLFSKDLLEGWIWKLVVSMRCFSL